jgi:hypothetical protein
MRSEIGGGGLVVLIARAINKAATGTCTMKRNID